MGFNSTGQASSCPLGPREWLDIRGWGKTREETQQELGRATHCRTGQRFIFSGRKWPLQVAWGEMGLTLEYLCGVSVWASQGWLSMEKESKLGSQTHLALYPSFTLCCDLGTFPILSWLLRTDCSRGSLSGSFILKFRDSSFSNNFSANLIDFLLLISIVSRGQEGFEVGE